jgi:hypothetical protein
MRASRVLTPISLAIAILAFKFVAAPAFGQAGGTGGTVGKQDKSISGGQAPADTSRSIPSPRKAISLRAAAYTRSTGVEVGGVAAWGLNSVHNSAPYVPKLNVVEYDFSASAGGHYRLDVEYAAAESRPVEISLNGAVVTAAGLAEVTGGWSDDFQKWTPQGNVTLKTGANTLRLKQSNYFPHIRNIRFVPE